MWDGSGYYGNTKVQLDTTGFAGDILSWSARVAFSLIDSPGASFFPKWTSIMDESLAGGGVLNLATQSYTIGQLGLFGLFLGTPDLYLQAGLMRSAFGPSFENSVVIGPQAPAAGHLSFSYSNDCFSFSTLLLDLVDKVDVTRLPHGKYLLLQTASLFPADWVSLGFVQTVVTGELLHLYYILPFPLQNLSYAAQMSGDFDTSLIGLIGIIRLPFGLSLDLTFYVDDWDSFSALSQSKGMLIDFNSAQDKFALDAVLSYCPPIDFLKRIRLEYQMVTPYTYTHASFYAVNWIMYTNAGANLGPILQPNSDRLELNVQVLPASWLDVNLSGRMIRHANASEGISSGDGTIYDDGFIGGAATFVGVPSRFLTRKVIETTFQARAEAVMDLRFNWVTLMGRLGYTFEYVANRDLVAGAETMKHYLNVSAGYRY